MEVELTIPYYDPQRRLDQPSHATRNVASQPDRLYLDGTPAILLAKARNRGEATDGASIP